MTSTHRLLDQLASLTSIQDLELLEFSLLKTLHGFLLPEAVSLFRLDGEGRPVMEVTFGDNKCSVRREELVISDELRQADEHIVASNAPQVVIRSGGRVLQVTALLSTRAGRSYLQLALKSELSKMDAHLVAGVLQIYRNFCSLLQSSQTDVLTGLSNRKTFDECVARVHELMPPASGEPAEHERRQGLATQFWLVMVDIDHFKLVNDRFGHLYGDEVLVLLARLMRSAFREDDLMFRFGGEEFVLIIRCPAQETCRATLDRFRRKVAETKFPRVGQVTISMGATQMDRDTFTGTLVNYADQALYYSKQNGRDRITFFEELVAVGLAKSEDITPGGIDYF